MFDEYSVTAEVVIDRPHEVIFRKHITLRVMAERSELLTSIPESGE